MRKMKPAAGIGTDARTSANTGAILHTGAAARCATLLLACLTSLSLTACGAGSSNYSAASETMAAVASSYGRSANSMAVEEYATEAAAYDSVSGDSYDGVSAEAGLSGVESTMIQPVSTNRKLIRTIDLSVETTEFDALLNQLSQSVTDLGGYTEQSSISGSSIMEGRSQSRDAQLTVRIPSDKLDAFVTQIGEQGNITNKSEHVEDITLQYSDIESRKKTLQIEQNRLWELLEQADSVDAVIALESRLSEIRYQLESMESQLRTYDNQVDYSTVYIYLNEVQVFTPTAPDSIGSQISKGFQQNLISVQEGFLSFFVWFVSHLPSLMVTAALIAVILAVIFGLEKRTKKKKSAPPMKEQNQIAAPEVPGSKDKNKKDQNAQQQ